MASKKTLDNMTRKKIEGVFVMGGNFFDEDRGWRESIAQQLGRIPGSKNGEEMMDTDDLQKLGT